MSTIYEKALACFKYLDNHAEAIGIRPDGTKVKLRLFKSHEDIGYFKKGSRKRGYRVDEFNTFIDILPITHYKTTQQKWETGWVKTKNRLEISGLWADVVKEITIALEIGYEKMKLLYDKYWEMKNEDERLAYIKQVDCRLIATDENGKEHIKSSLVWNYAKLPKVKKMRFHNCREQNEAALQSIQKAMADKKTLHMDGRTGYDVSFEYAPEKGNKAWYSEEFKNCGNGHYYLAISPTHALFSEDD